MGAILFFGHGSEGEEMLRCNIDEVNIGPSRDSRY